jgi:hypothetical protein
MYKTCQTFPGKTVQEIRAYEFGKSFVGPFRKLSRILLCKMKCKMLFYLQLKTKPVLILFSRTHSKKFGL